MNKHTPKPQLEAECTCGKDDFYGSLYYPHTQYCLKNQDVQVAPGIYQSIEDYEANRLFDEDRDNQLTDPTET